MSSRYRRVSSTVKDRCLFVDTRRYEEKESPQCMEKIPPLKKCRNGAIREYYLDVQVSGLATMINSSICLTGVSTIDQ
eukprot:scaffold3073_cov66-Cylindrotheca_fusiformis.AAC.15